MKTALKLTASLFLVAFISSGLHAQEVASLSPPSGEKTTNGNPAAPPARTDLVITLKNSSEIPVVIFAGPKEGIRDPKIQMVGGLSKNTLYLQNNDVVCLMTHQLRSDMKPIACTHITPTTSMVEVSVSANTISSK